MTDKKPTVAAFTQYLVTREDVQDATMMIDTAIERLFDQSGSIPDALAAAFPPAWQDAVLKIAKETDTETLDEPIKMEQFLRDLKEQLQQIPVIELELAFHPSEMFLKKITAWISQQIGIAALLDIRLNRGLIAGPVIRFQGKVHDYSVAQAVEAATT